MKESPTSSPTRIAGADAIHDAAQLLLNGHLVAFPTETVYGLGADARSDSALQKIYEAKGRPPTNPLIVHIHDLAAAQACTSAWPDIATTLAEKFWPGPLTLILPRRERDSGRGVSPLVAAGRPTIALRCPNHPIAQSLLRAFNAPIAAPSANRSGFTSPTTAQHVFAELNGRIPLILDGGPTTIGLESTVLDLTTSPPKVLRPGAITREMLQPLLPNLQLAPTSLDESQSSASPGQFARHYAPRTPAHTFPRSAFASCGPSIKRYAALLTTSNAKAVLITHDPAITLQPPHETLLLPANPADYARHLYASLRQADDLHASCILILQPDTNHGLWTAIIDRLTRATTPFPPT